MLRGLGFSLIFGFRRELSLPPLLLQGARGPRRSTLDEYHGNPNIAFLWGRNKTTVPVNRFEAIPILIIRLSLI